MKKWNNVLIASALAVSLAACGSKVDPGAATNGASAPPASSPTSTAQAPAASSAPTVGELINKTMEASQSLKSYSMDSQIEQKMTMTQNDQKQEQAIKMAIKTDMINEPLAMVQEISMNMPGLPSSQQIKQYITQDGIFMQTQGKWMKLPAEMKDQLLQAVQNQASPQKQLEQFNTIVKDTKVTEEGGHYVLDATVSGDHVKDLVKGFMSGTGPGGANPQIEALMQQMKIQSMKIKYVIKKDGYIPVSMNVAMLMDMEQQGQKMSMDMKMDSTFSNYNAVKEIKVPQEALNSATGT
ncbi:DUF6612 family protein [Paenibacillus filicis]|uniref:DUF6612 family protein n=1 Tax=Paenibacillus filicis TaxID=669464 RepID=A0ABU9DN96_9BACL